MSLQEWSSRRAHDCMNPFIDNRLCSLYLFRSMLQVSGIKYSRGPHVSIMTYNVLFSIGKKKAWSVEGLLPHRLRERVLISEISRYDPDILCLQEVAVGDADNIWWQEQLFQLGYELTFVYVGPKDHGIGICFKHSLFTEICHDHSNYDEITNDDNEALLTSNRPILILCLGFTEKFLQDHTLPSREGIIICTTHLSVSSVDRHEKMEQAQILIRKTERFAEHIRTQTSSDFRFYTFIAGDFNSRDFDSAYSPAKLPCPLQTQYGNNPSKVCYDEFMQQRNKLIDVHQKVYDKLISLYSIAYRIVAPDITPNHLWRFIDYIFVVQDNKLSTNPETDAIAELSRLSDIKLLALLRIPTKLELGKSRLSQPAIGICPSDHYCLMAELELL